MSESALKTFIHGSAVTLAGSLLLGGFNFLIRRKLSLELTQEDYGIFYSGIALFSMFFSWGNLGISQSGTVLIAKNADRPKRHDCFMTVLMMKMFSGLLIFSIIVMFSESISQKYWGKNCSWLLLILGIYFVFDACFAAFQTLLVGLKKFTVLLVFQLLSSIAILVGITLIPAIRLSHAATIFACGTLLTSAVSLVYGSCSGLVKWKLPLSGNIWKQMLHLTSWLAISTMLFSTLSQMDTVMLTSMKGAQSAAAYNIGLPIMQIVQSCLIFPTVFLPIAVQLCKDNEYSKLMNFVRWAVIVSLLGGISAFLFFHLSGKFWIRLLFSAKYDFVSPLLPWLCAGIVFFATGNFFVQILIVLNRLKHVALIAAIVFFMNIMLNYILIRKFDYIGAGEATFGSYLIFAVLTLLLTCHYGCRKIQGKRNE